MSLKMYVWHDFMTDWEPGMACALAESLEEALMELEIALEDVGWEFSINDAKKVKPLIFEKPGAAFVQGGS